MNWKPWILVVLMVVAGRSAATPEQDAQLAEAVILENLPVVEQLLAGGANASHVEDGRSVLGWAVQGGNMEIVMALLEAGANPDAGDRLSQTPLMQAIVLGHADLIPPLIEAGSDLSLVNGQGQTLMILAAESGNAEVVRALSELGVPVDVTDLSMNTPVMAAIKNQNSELVEVIGALGAAGADLDSGDGFTTPVYMAVETQQPQVLEALLDAGADPSLGPDTERPPILAAASYPEMLEALLEAGADPNARNRFGDPVLFLAIEAGNEAAVRVLVEAGADVNLENEEGRTPLAHAEGYNEEGLATLLREAGADSESAAEEVPSETPSGPAPLSGEGDAELLALPRLESDGLTSGVGGMVTYYSQAAVGELLDFYDPILEQAGWRAGERNSDYEVYATAFFHRGEESLTLTLGQGSDDDGLVLVSLVPHGVHKAGSLPRVAGTTAVFESDPIAMYTAEGSVAQVADQTLALLRGAGWQGEATVSQDDMRVLTLAQGDTTLTVQVAVARAMNDKTSIQYNLLKNGQ